MHSLTLFFNIEVNPRPDEKNEWGFIVEIKLNELEQYNAEGSTDWSIVPERQGRPTMPSIQPGSTITIEHQNLQGLNRSLLGSITTSNFIDPQFEYIHPYLDGVKDHCNMTFCSRCFNSGKLSLFPPIWVDRAGVKANITENFTRQSEITYGLALEKIITQNESTNISQNGQRQLPNGGISAHGPPITLSGTGVIKLGFFQANITRDNTKLVNGAIDSKRNVFQLTYTKFLQLKPVEGVDKPPPPVLVLHGHYGGCIAYLPSYDAFTLGGPYCVRGYNKGELGACRNILEKGRETAFPRGGGSKAHNERAAFLADIVLARSRIKYKEGSKSSTNGDGTPAYNIVDPASSSVHGRIIAEVGATSDDMPNFRI
ncbi:hypothetical protein MKX03_009101 [Papaver bracteatum]|nr:hypothetical protein MKX03_009101 [Papaver bracteatum]